jgi:hypothetical protein
MRHYDHATKDTSHVLLEWCCGGSLLHKVVAVLEECGLGWYTGAQEGGEEWVLDRVGILGLECEIV